MLQNDPDKQSYMPKDGTVHELTSNVRLALCCGASQLSHAGCMNKYESKVCLFHGRCGGGEI